MGRQIENYYRVAAGIGETRHHVLMPIHIYPQKQLSFDGALHVRRHSKSHIKVIASGATKATCLRWYPKRPFGSVAMLMPINDRKSSRGLCLDRYP